MLLTEWIKSLSEDFNWQKADFKYLLCFVEKAPGCDCSAGSVVVYSQTNSPWHWHITRVAAPFWMRWLIAVPFQGMLWIETVWLQPINLKKKKKVASKILGSVDCDLLVKLWQNDQHLIHPSLGAKFVKTVVGYLTFSCFAVSLQRCLWICSLLAHVPKCYMMSLPFLLRLLFLFLDWRYIHIKHWGQINF